MQAISINDAFYKFGDERKTRRTLEFNRFPCFGYRSLMTEIFLFPFVFPLILSIKNNRYLFF